MQEVCSVCTSCVFELIKMHTIMTPCCTATAAVTTAALAHTLMLPLPLPSAWHMQYSPSPPHPHPSELIECGCDPDVLPSSTKNSISAGAAAAGTTSSLAADAIGLDNAIKSLHKPKVWSNSLYVIYTYIILYGLVYVG